MCPTRIEPKLQPIELDLSSAFSFQRGFGRAELLQLGPELEQARRARLEASASETASGPIPPRQMLLDYHRQRKHSLLGHILSRAKQLRDSADRVVVLAPPPLAAAGQALFAACGHPHHNNLSRGQRGGRPRIYFLPAAPDNDALQSLLEILPHDRLLHTVDDRWGLLALDSDVADGSDNERLGLADVESNGALLTGLFSFLWDILQTTATASDEAQLAAVVGPRHSSLVALAEQIGLAPIESHSHSDQSPPAASRPLSAFFHPGVLLAASVVGLDIVKLLHGVTAMCERFASAPPGENPPLDFAGLCYLFSQRHGNPGFRISSTYSALNSLAQNLQRPRGPDDLLIQWTAHAARHDRLHISMPASVDHADRKKRKDVLLADLAAAHAQAIRAARDAAGQYTVAVRLANVDEASIGQLIQLHTISSAIENDLVTPNP